MTKLILAASFVFVLIVGYAAIEGLFCILDPDKSYSGKYRVAIEHFLMLQPILKYFDQKKCMLFTGCREEIMSELEKANVDFAIVEREPTAFVKDEKGMNHIRASYQPCEPVLDDHGRRVYLLSDKTRDLDVYYSEAMVPVVQKMLINSIITKIN